MSELDNFDNYLVSHRVRTVEKRLFQVDLMVMQNSVLNFSSSMFHICFEKDCLLIHRLGYRLDRLLYWLSPILIVGI